MNEKMNDLRKGYTDRIIEMLEQGTVPWSKPWTPESMPQSAVSGKAYNGINNFLLNFVSIDKGYIDSRWCTYKQAQEKGWQVRRGEKGTPIEYWQYTKTEVVLDENRRPVIDAGGKQVTETVKLSKPIYKVYYVFNAAQIDGMPEFTPEKYQWEPAEKAEEIIKLSGANILHNSSNEAFYNPSLDEIHLPLKEQFKSAEGYYATALHELGHWTGHESRLNRNIYTAFGTPEYAKEELRAELASYFLSQETGIANDTSRHAAYIDNWIKVLKNDKNEIFRAAADASRIADYIMEPYLEKEMDKPEINENTILLYDKAPADIKLHILRNDYKNQDFAKDNGALYDSEKKTWYIPKGIEVKPFQNLLPEGKFITATDTELPAKLSKEQGNEIKAYWSKEKEGWVLPAGRDLEYIPKSYFEHTPEVVKTFEEFAAEYGLIIHGQAIQDGKLHRVAVERPDGKLYKRDGAYAYFNDQFGVNGWVINYFTNEKAKYKSSNENQVRLSPEEVKKLAAAKEAERKKEYDKKAKSIGYLFKSVFTKAKTHDYLDKKGIQSHGIFINKDNELAIPIRNMNGTIRSMQLIKPDGNKKIVNELSGNFFTFGQPKDKIIICEGFATGASIYEATKTPVVCAFQVNNLAKVTEQFREKFGDNLKIIIAADNDHQRVNRKGEPENIGVIEAQKVGKQFNAEVIVPQFTKQEMKKGLTDFNDLSTSRSAEEVLKQFSKIISLEVFKNKAIEIH